MEALFPFYFVCSWVKLCASGEHCHKCDKEAIFVFEEYADISPLQGALRDPDALQAIVDTIWTKTINEQMQGIYKKDRDVHYCQGCAYYTVARWGGATVARIALPSMVETKIGSLVLGSRVRSLEDNGDSLVMATSAETIEELAEHLRNEPVSVQLRPQEKQRPAWYNQDKIIIKEDRL